MLDGSEVGEHNGITKLTQSSRRSEQSIWLPAALTVSGLWKSSHPIWL